MKKIFNLAVKIIALIRAYFNHIIKQKSIYNIHSPFIYEFCKNVLKSKKAPKSYARHSLLNNKSKFEKHDYGALRSERNKFISVRKSTHKSAISEKFAKLLHNLVQYYQPKKILELGTHFGLATLAMHEANPNAQIHSVEACPNTYNVANKNIQEYAPDPDQINLINSTFETFINQSTETNFDLFYIDGNHLFQSTLNYYRFAYRVSSQNSIFIFDDINWSSSMQEAWQQIKNDEQNAYIIDLFRMGIIFKRPFIQKQEFKLKY